MRNFRALTMIVFAVVAGLAAAILAVRWLAQQTNVSVGRIAVATSDLGVGQPIANVSIRMVDWPVGSIPEGSFSDAAELEARVVKSGIVKGEPIVEARLAPKGTKGGLSAVIANGKRAITVRVNDVVGVAGFALPGNFVDVIVNTTAEQNNDKESSVSKIVLERILVLAIAQEASRDDTKPKVVNAVTLEVTPREAEIIDLARSVGALSLVLRNQTEDSASNTRGATKQLLLGQAPPKAAPVPAAAPKPVRVVKVEPTVPEPAPARAQNCVEALVGSERKLECFSRQGS